MDWLKDKKKSTDNRGDRSSVIVVVLVAGFVMFRGPAAPTVDASAPTAPVDPMASGAPQPGAPPMAPVPWFLVRRLRVAQPHLRPLPARRRGLLRLVHAVLWWRRSLPLKPIVRIRSCRGIQGSSYWAQADAARVRPAIGAFVLAPAETQRC